MEIIQIKQLGDNWSMRIRYGKRTTYALYLHSNKVKTFWSEKALRDWLDDVRLAEEFGNP
jgi:hypothetical protein